MVKWAKVVVREAAGAPSRAMRRAQGRLIQSIAQEAAAPMQAANDASMIVVLGDQGKSDPAVMRRLARPAGAAEVVDQIIQLLTPPDTEVSISQACDHYREFVAAKKDSPGPDMQWPAYRALVMLQLSVWHHTGVDPSPVVRELVDTAVEPDDSDAFVRRCVASYVEQVHDSIAESALRKHGGVEGLRTSLGVGEDVRLRTAISPGGHVDADPDREPPRIKDVVEPVAGLLAVVPSLENDLGDVLEHMEAETAPAGIPCSKVHWRRNQMEVIIEDNLLKTVLRCTCNALSEPDPMVAECMACGTRDCPQGHELHYHHDGCPACTQEDEQRELN